jgi:hypothetical protein
MVAARRRGRTISRAEDVKRKNGMVEDPRRISGGEIGMPMREWFLGCAPWLARSRPVAPPVSRLAHLRVDPALEMGLETTLSKRQILL